MNTSRKLTTTERQAIARRFYRWRPQFPFGASLVGEGGAPMLDEHRKIITAPPIPTEVPKRTGQLSEEQVQYLNTL